MKNYRFIAFIALTFVSFNAFAAELICNPSIKKINAQLAQKKDITISAPIARPSSQGIIFCVSVNEK